MNIDAHGKPTGGEGGERWREGKGEGEGAFKAFIA